MALKIADDVVQVQLSLPNRAPTRPWPRACLVMLKERPRGLMSSDDSFATAVGSRQIRYELVVDYAMGAAAFPDRRRVQESIQLFTSIVRRTRLRRRVLRTIAPPRRAPDRAMTISALMRSFDTRSRIDAAAPATAGTAGLDQNDNRSAKCNAILRAPSASSPSIRRSAIANRARRSLSFNARPRNRSLMHLPRGDRKLHRCDNQAKYGCACAQNGNPATPNTRLHHRRDTHLHSPTGPNGRPYGAAYTAPAAQPTVKEAITSNCPRGVRGERRKASRASATHLRSRTQRLLEQTRIQQPSKLMVGSRQ